MQRVMKWCGCYNCWCDEIEDIIEIPECDLECGCCDDCEDIK